MKKDWTKVNRDTLRYLEIVLQEITDFEAFIQTDAAKEEKRTAFHKLMTLTVGCSRDWKRLWEVARESGFAPGILRRYVTHTTAPSEAAYRYLAQDIRTVITKEYKAIEAVVVADEKAAREKQERENRAFKELVDRILHIVPDTFYNCGTEYKNPPGKSYSQKHFPLSMGISYPCRGMYNFDDHMPHICTLCAQNEQPAPHGHVVLSGPDGLALLPHTIYSQTDVQQAIADMEAAQVGGYYFSSREAGEMWYAGCKEHMRKSEFIASIPKHSEQPVQSHDLNEKGIMWIF